MSKRLFNSGWIQRMVLSGKMTPALGAALLTFRLTRWERIKVWWRLRRVPVEARDWTRRILYLTIASQRITADAINDPIW